MVELPWKEGSSFPRPRYEISLGTKEVAVVCCYLRSLEAYVCMYVCMYMYMYDLINVAYDVFFPLPMFSDRATLTINFH